MTRQVLCVAATTAALPAELLAAVQTFDVCLVAGMDEAAACLREQHFPVGLLLLDGWHQPFGELDHFLRRHSRPRWVALFRSEALEDAPIRQLVHEHCVDFHTWPLDPGRLSHTLGHALGLAALGDGTPLAAACRDMRLTGHSRAIGLLRQQILKVAGADAPVLIWGESGTGKELVARAIHEHSGRANGPFVPINCGAIPASLVQSELFGYEKGAFTGAGPGKCGLVESASGGAIFLDEIGDLPLELQANLLRFLQEKTIYRVGGTRSVPVDVRVIAASHVKLAEAVERGHFREDLFYRLNVLTLQVPALRERRDDVVALAEEVFHSYATERARGVRGFSNSALRALRAHDWPGNVRELLNRVRRAAVMADGALIQPQDLELDGAGATLTAEDLDSARAGAERLALQGRLDAGLSVTSVARDLGVSRMTLYRLMAKHGIQRPSRRGEG
ncbi:sigma-54 dependent transcriptional regulator [Pseudoduganella violaceinigra]|uniref:sigma-54 dependent transcriptional regulator n=1 Tax=Pseudoduganella violaceinigra TaxID=246602 RepID=UPI000488195D|nr:sigma-54 dependent transcriptional regulator [Pseudoduganella violaceinigra]